MHLAWLLHTFYIRVYFCFFVDFSSINYTLTYRQFVSSYHSIWPCQNELDYILFFFRYFCCKLLVILSVCLHVILARMNIVFIVIVQRIEIKMFRILYENTWSPMLVQMENVRAQTHSHTCASTRFCVWEIFKNTDKENKYCKLHTQNSSVIRRFVDVFRYRFVYVCMSNFIEH